MTNNEFSYKYKVDKDFDFQSVFNAEDYLYFYENSLKDKYTREEVDFLIRELNLDKPKNILDLACGHGRHANKLAGFGHKVTGVDNNQEFLDIAKEDAIRSGVTVQYFCGDARGYKSPDEYDCVIHLFSSFGYFPDDENEQVIRNVAKSLKPGGLFCLDILNRDAFLKDFPRYSVKEKNSDLMIDRNRFDPYSGRLYNSRIIIRDGKRRDAPFFLRLYNPTEIILLLKQAGFVPDKIYGNWDGKPFNGDSKRMILVSEKSDVTS
jgi:SAM-dependent methyltransferase